MARDYQVVITSDLTGKEIPDGEVVTVELRFPDGRRLRGEISVDEARDVGKTFTDVKQRAKNRPRRADGTLM